MFDFFRSSAKVKKYLLGGLLLIVAASMVTYLIPNTNLTTSATSTGDDIIAKVGDDVITAAEARTAVDRLVSSGQLPRDAASVYLPQVTDQMIQDKAVQYAFDKLGLKVTDEEVLIALSSIFPQLFKDGKVISTD